MGHRSATIAEKPSEPADRRTQAVAFGRAMRVLARPPEVAAPNIELAMAWSAELVAVRSNKRQLDRSRERSIETLTRRVAAAMLRASRAREGR